MPITSAELSGKTAAPAAAPAEHKPFQSPLERFLQPIVPSTTLSDYWEGPKHALLHPIESAGLLSDAITSDPVGAIPVVGNAKRAVSDVGEGNYAGAAGETVSGLLQLLGLRKAAPSTFSAAADMGAGATEAVGRGVSATGRGMEAVGASKPVRHISRWGATGALATGRPMEAAALAATAPGLEYGGKVIQKVGGKLEGAREGLRALRGEKASGKGYRPGASKEVPYRGPSGVSDVYTEETPDLEVRSADTPAPATDIYGDPEGLNDSAALHREMVDMGYKPRTAQTIAFGKDKPLPKAPKAAKPQPQPPMYGRTPINVERAQAMGDATLGDLRMGGYDVPERGFQTSHDIDQLLKGPTDEVDLSGELPLSLTPMDKLAARLAEKYGQRFRPEF